MFERQPRDQWLHVAFASHRGAGKTTELNRLADEISPRYCAVYFEANVELDATKFEIEDLLLVIARVVEERMRAEGTPLPEASLRKVEDFFSKVVFTDDAGTRFMAKVAAEAKLKGGVPFFATLMANLTSSLQVDSEHKRSV